MTSPYTRRGKPVSINAVDSDYHRHRLDVDARFAYIYVAGTLMMVATAGSMVILILSVTALQGVYGWYPQFVAQQWFMYDQVFTAFSFLGLVSGALATILIMSKRSYRGAVASATVCTLSGTSIFVVSLVQPLAVLWQSVLYYLLPLFIAPLTGTLLTYLQREETEKSHVPPKKAEMQHK